MNLPPSFVRGWHGLLKMCVHRSLTAEFNMFHAPLWHGTSQVWPLSISGHASHVKGPCHRSQDRTDAPPTWVGLGIINTGQELTGGRI